MKTNNILIPLGIGLLFWGCTEHTPLGIDQHVLDEPDSNPTIATSNYTNGTNFSTGYYNGKIRTDRTQLEWDESTDENFLCYKIFRATGYEFDGSNIYEGFEDGILPSGWTEYGDNFGWYVTDSGTYEGDYAVRSYSGYYDLDTLEKTISVPQNADIFISFLSKGVDDGNGYFYINGSLYETWGYDYNGSYWDYSSEYIFTGVNTEITLQWVYSSESYGYGVLDNIEISGIEGGNLSYSLIETLNDKTTTTLMDTTLTQNQYYTYKIANIIDTGIPTINDIAIKTPLWQSPSNIFANGLSPEAVELNWDGNSESETAFKIYIDTVDVNYWNYAMVDSTTAGQDDTSKVIIGLSETAQYRFSIKATNSWEDDTQLAYSSSFVFQFDSPSNLVASQGFWTKAIELTWYDNSSMESGFEIERGNSADTNFVLIATVDADSTSYIDADTSEFGYDSTYTYRIRAYNNYSGTIYTDYSSIASVTLSETNGIFIDFEDGQYPSGWSNWGYSGWYVTNDDAYDGNYSIRCHNSYNNYEYLETTIDVPQNTYVAISFNCRGEDDGDGYFYIDGSQLLNWGFDSYGSSWYSYQNESYYTSSNSQITLQWQYFTESYGHGYLDNIQVTW